MGLLDKTNKRQRYPVELEDRTVYVRALTYGETDRMNAMPKDGPKAAFLLGKILVDKSGTPEAPQNEGESDIDYGKRVAQLLEEAEVDAALALKLMREAGKVGTGDTEDIAKNSPATAKPDSPADSVSLSDGGTGGT